MCSSRLTLQFEHTVHIKSMILFSHTFYTGTRPSIWAELLLAYISLSQVLCFLRILSKHSYSSKIPCQDYFRRLIQWPETYFNTPKAAFLKLWMVHSHLFSPSGWGSQHLLVELWSMNHLLTVIWEALSVSVSSVWHSCLWLLVCDVFSFSDFI